MIFILHSSSLAPNAEQRPWFDDRHAHARIQNLPTLFGNDKRVAVEFRNLRIKEIEKK